MPWLRGLVIALAIFQGSYMAFDGAYALVTGNYLTPRSGPFAHQLGPWASVVKAAGIEPRSFLMRFIFLAYGSALLAATYRFARRRPWGRALLLLAEIGSLWWVGAQTPVALTQILILLLLSDPPAEPAAVAPVAVEVPAEAELPAVAPAEPPA
jgi:hypothetical protein